MLIISFPLLKLHSLQLLFACGSFSSIAEQNLGQTNCSSAQINSKSNNPVSTTLGTRTVGRWLLSIPNSMQNRKEKNHFCLSNVQAAFSWHCVRMFVGDVICGRGAKTMAVPGWMHLYWEMPVLFCWCHALLLVRLAHSQYSEYYTLVFLSQQRLPVWALMDEK